MDFLAQYGAVIDCWNNRLTLLPEQREVHNRGAECGRAVPSLISLHGSDNEDPRAVTNIGEREIGINSVIEGFEVLLEPTDRPSKKGLLTARSLSNVGSNNEVLVHVINVRH